MSPSLRSSRLPNLPSSNARSLRIPLRPPSPSPSSLRPDNVDHRTTPQPKAVSETEDTDLKAMMEDAARANAEVSGDDSDESE